MNAEELVMRIIEHADPSMEVVVDGLPLRYIVIIDGKVHLGFTERKEG